MPLAKIPASVTYLLRAQISALYSQLLNLAPEGWSFAKLWSPGEIDLADWLCLPGYERDAVSTLLPDTTISQRHQHSLTEVGLPWYESRAGV